MKQLWKRPAAVLLAAVMTLSVPAASYAGVVQSGKRIQNGTTASTEGTAGSGTSETTAAPANGGTSETTAAPANTGNTGAQKTADTGTSSGTGTGVPGTKAFNKTAASDIKAAVAAAGLDALGIGNTPADPILNQVQFVNYFLKNGDGVNLDFVPSNENRPAVAPDGFSKLYMIHDGVARFYYRTYTDAHGWSPWCIGTETTPYNEDGTKVQAVQIRVKGYAHTLNHLYYKVVLNDGTVLDWAKDGQTTGTMGTDRYIVALRIGLWNRNIAFPYATTNLMAGCKYEGAYQGSDGVVRYSSFNGQPYTGWGYIDNTQYYFVNGEHATGWQYADGYKYFFNDDGSLCTDLEPVMGLPGDYRINYNKATRTMYIMVRDGDNGYIIPFKTFNSTCGPDTPLGDYSTFAKYNVKFMHDDIYCKYLSRFYAGFLIHSILFYTQDLNLDAITYNYMDDAASGGCIRLLTGDAYWVYSNCPMHTTVHIYSDVWDKGPVEKGAIDQVIPRSQTWDPSDPAYAERAAEEKAAAAAEAAANAGDHTAAREDAELVDALKSE